MPSQYLSIVQCFKFIPFDVSLIKIVQTIKILCIYNIVSLNHASFPHSIKLSCLAISFDQVCKASTNNQKVYVAVTT